MTGWIYMIRNLINDLRYIGQTIDLDRRLKDHKRSKYDDYFHNSIRKYGWNNFEVIILHDNIPLQDLNWLEKQCIWIYNTRSPNGYNLQNGGKNGLHSKEDKEKTSRNKFR